MSPLRPHVCHVLGLGAEPQVPPPWPKHAVDLVEAFSVVSHAGGRVATRAVVAHIQAVRNRSSDKLPCDAVRRKFTVSMRESSVASPGSFARPYPAFTPLINVRPEPVRLNRLGTANVSAIARISAEHAPFDALPLWKIEGGRALWAHGISSGSFQRPRSIARPRTVAGRFGRPLYEGNATGQAGKLHGHRLAPLGGVTPPVVSSNAGALSRQFYHMSRCALAYTNNPQADATEAA